MKPTKKEIEEAKQAAEAKKKTISPKMTHINELWDVVEEIEKNLAFLNDKMERILARLGLQS